MRVLLAGFGSVGRSVASLLADRQDDLYRRMGLNTKLVGVFDSRGAAIDPRGLDYAKLIDAKQSTGSVASAGASSSSSCSIQGPFRDEDALRLIRDTQADVFIEATPSVLANPGPSFERLKAAMSSRKHTISVNKAPLAKAMPALVELARFNRVQFRYSGTVGAGTPVLATARSLMGGDTILRIRGILNGTTNFILHRMSEQGESYSSALAQAMQLGYAESDPSTDVDGIDTATKVVIIANAVLRMGATMDAVRIQGIRDISASVIQDAKARNEVIKLIGMIDAQTGALSVAPTGVPRHGPMDVPEALNAVEFELECAGRVALVGRGAGGPETATGVLRDLVDIWHAAGAVL